MGRKRPAHRVRLHLRNYLALAELPTPPEAVDYSAAAMTALQRIYRNDQLGDCVIAGGYHVVGVATGNAGDLFLATDDQITADYEKIGGYKPGDESTDNGCDEQTAFEKWQADGFANGTKLVGAVAVDATSPTELKQGIDLFENCFFGIELPDAWINPFPSATGFVWDVAGEPNPENGHCIVGVGYNSTGIQIATWGIIGTITWAAVAKYAAPTSGGEVYILLTPDQIDKAKGKAPCGLTWDQLLSDFDALAGGIGPGPLPLPPAPTAPDTPTLEQVQRWAAQGIAENWPVEVDKRFDG